MIPQETMLLRLSPAMKNQNLFLQLLQNFYDIDPTDFPQDNPLMRKLRKSMPKSNPRFCRNPDISVISTCCHKVNLIPRMISAFGEKYAMAIKANYVKGMTDSICSVKTSLSTNSEIKHWNIIICNTLYQSIYSGN